jgi:hypothetical protein
MGGGPPAQTQADEAAKQSQQQSAETYATTAPGLKAAEAYYTKLSSGDPSAIFSAVAPSVNSIIGNTEATKKNILANAPRGGEANLAIEEADISKAAQIGNLQTSAYTSSFPALANLASTGLGLSVNEMANALQGYQSVMQNQSANKASTMGFFGSLASGAGMAACWIAAVVFKENFFTGPRVTLVRRWLANDYAKTFIGKYVVAAYCKYGERAARVISKSVWLKQAFRALFDVALKKAEAKYKHGWST